MIFVDTPTELLPASNSRPNRMLLAASVSSFSNISYPELEQRDTFSSSSASSSSSSSSTISNRFYLSFDSSKALTKTIQSSCVNELVFDSPTSSGESPDSCDEDDARDDDLYETQLQQHRQAIEQQRFQQAAFQQQKRQAMASSSRAFTDSHSMSTWNPARVQLPFDAGRTAPHSQSRSHQSKQRQKGVLESVMELKQHLLDQQQQMQFQQILHEQRQQILMQLQLQPEPQLTTIPPPELTLPSLQEEEIKEEKGKE
jgi:hypothetical protein